MRIVILSLALFSMAATCVRAGDRPDQLIIVSFDGAHDNALWVKSRAMAARTGAHFTYFLSCTFLKSWGSAEQLSYQAPHHRAGRSATGFAQSKEEIRVRLDHIWQAHLEGHEIANHACGHFDGSGWSEADWTREFRAFTSALSEGWKTAGAAAMEPAGWRDFAAHGIVGFRAPYLSPGDALPNAVRAAGFRYDASLITKGPALPANDRGLLRFGLPLIPEGPGGKPVIAMDYNLYARHSGTREDVARGAEFEERTLQAYRNAFASQFDADRLPLQLGFHFVEMNGGAYWRALDRFLTVTCHRPGVACVSYEQALDRLRDRPALREPKAGALVARQP